LTERRKEGESKGKQALSADAFHSDPRIRAIVRFLARRAAEADFALALEGSRAPRHNPQKRK